ncbi:MAG TPA: hypothetical protein DCE08_05315 [Ruminococcaceae bacterium]|nr:hypothetical protein [Oscillospiraceae bacterium]
MYIALILCFCAACGAFCQPRPAKDPQSCDGRHFGAARGVDFVGERRRLTTLFLFKSYRRKCGGKNDRALPTAGRGSDYGSAPKFSARVRFS